MIKRIGSAFGLSMFLLLAPSEPFPVSALNDDIIDIPYQKFVLDNGLRLIVHEDRKAPIVAVNVWYHVGSKDEKEGRTGFAHLFEHIMFNGSENYNDDYFQLMERIGATGLNGTTSFDRTNYFQNVPTTALDVALWLESDRMGHLLGVVDQERLDEQRGVVQNEKRQGDNQPFGRVFYSVFESLFPKGHPYAWTPIGSMEDLDAARLEDVHEWFRTYYGAANAVIVIAGDIDAETARAKVEEYFGHIPAGPPLTRMKRWVPERSGEIRRLLQDEKAPNARYYKVWATPEFGSAEADYLDLVTEVLSTGKTSRLYKRLVYDEQIATHVFSWNFPLEIAGIAAVIVDVREGVDIERVEKAVNEELIRFLEKGPTGEELTRIKAQKRAEFVRGVERIGGFGGKSDVLAEGEVYLGDAGFHTVVQRRQLTATASDLLAAARSWMAHGGLVVEVHPIGDHRHAESGVDRSQIPEPGLPPKASFPAFDRTELSNGLQVIVARRDSVPQVNLQLLIDAGYAADQFYLPGTASLALEMLDEGTTHLDALQISDRLASLGASLTTGANLDLAWVRLSALKENLVPSLELYAEVVLNPSFPAEELERVRPRRVAQIRQEMAQPNSLALRVLPRLLYGEGHAYATPLTGSGFEKSVLQLTRQDLLRFHQEWFKPNNATLVVVGDTTLAEITPELERVFAGWNRGEAPKKSIGRVEHAHRPAIYLIDRPGSVQSMILAGHLAPPNSDPVELALTAANRIIGGSFTSRINMNLREDKGWSYGSRTTLVSARGPRPFLILAPVQTDKTAEAVQEIVKELEGIRNQEPPTEHEVDQARRAQTLTLPGRWETMDAIASSLVELVRFRYPDYYWQTYPERVNRLGVGQIQQAVRDHLNPERLVWVIVGDRQKIEAEIRALDLAPIQMLDPEGKPIGTTAARHH